MLAACVQSAGPAGQMSSLSRPAIPQANRMAARPFHRHVVIVHRKHTPFATKKDVAKNHAARTVGLASFYGHESRTASGETFNSRELTAAHRTLPFGTRLRVTDLATGRSVTVRVNDRGPFVPGRIVDVSASAAETLGMTERGVAKVKVDVVE